PARTNTATPARPVELDAERGGALVAFVLDLSADHHVARVITQDVGKQMSSKGFSAGKEVYGLQDARLAAGVGTLKEIDAAGRREIEVREVSEAADPESGEPHFRRAPGGAGAILAASLLPDRGVRGGSA